MNDNIIRFYMFANILKNKLRTGWVEIEINKDRTESIADHVYGCLILALAIDSEYKLNLDMLKVLKILTLHELEEILMPDYTIRSGLTKKEKNKRGMICASKVIEGLIKEDEINKLLLEFNERNTKEAIFCHLVDKIECDFQAKLYDLEKAFDEDKAKEDLKYYKDSAKYVEDNAKCASDYWILYDEKIYKHNPLFETLLKDIRNINENFYKNIINTKIDYKGDNDEVKRK